MGVDRNAGKTLGVTRFSLTGASLADAVVETEVPNLFLVPASIDLSGGELRAC